MSKLPETEALIVLFSAIFSGSKIKPGKYQVLNKVDMLNSADNMPGKWQLLIFLGQQTILNLQAEGSNCS